MTELCISSIYVFTGWLNTRNLNFFRLFFAHDILWHKVVHGRRKNPKKVWKILGNCRFWFEASLPRPPRHHFGQKKFRRENWPNSTSRRARDLPNSSKRSSLRGLQVPQQSRNSQNCSWGSTAPIKMSWYRRPRAFFMDACRKCLFWATKNS